MVAKQKIIRERKYLMNRKYLTKNWVWSWVLVSRKNSKAIGYSIPCPFGGFVIQKMALLQQPNF